MKGSHIKNKQYWKEKIKSDIQRKNFKKQIFGNHYNLASIRLNNNKKYFNEQVQIMQIERSNRLLLQKIKKISERSKPRHIIERARTEVIQNEPFIIERSNTEEKFKQDKMSLGKRQRYSSVQRILEKNRLKQNQLIVNKNQTEHKRRNELNIQDEGNKVIIYKGNKRIQRVHFSFEIYIENAIYHILCKTKISEQMIEIPQENYQVLLKHQLENDYRNIFKHLKLYQNNKLRLVFKESSNIEVSTIERSQIELPLIKSQSMNTTNS